MIVSAFQQGVQDHLPFPRSSYIPPSIILTHHPLLRPRILQVLERQQPQVVEPVDAVGQARRLAAVEAAAPDGRVGEALFPANIRHAVRHYGEVGPC